MTNPLDLVRRLTSDEFASLRDEVAAGRVESALKSLRQRDAGAELVREQYAGRYPLELVQNANDAVASEGVKAARIKVVVTESALLVADTGAGFGTAQVESICDLAQSSKDPRKSVGYKGLGFKSVAEITDTPQVISGELRFGFDRGRLRAEVETIIGRELDTDFPLPDYAFPFELADTDFGNDAATVLGLQEDGFRTVLRLPFRDEGAAADAAAHVGDTIVPRLLLFLDAAESLELVGTSTDFHAEALREGDAQQQYVMLQAGERSEQFWMYRKEVPIRDPKLTTELGKAWRQVEAVRIAAAVPLDREGHPEAIQPEPLHVYFPTEEETGLSVIFNADFQVELDRRRIASAGAPGEYNEWLVAELAEFVAEVVVPDLTDRYGGACTVDVLAPHDSPTYTGERVLDALFDSLRGAAWVPCQDGQLRAPADVTLAPDTVPDLKMLHARLVAPEMVSCEVEDDHRCRALLTDVFDCPEMSVETALCELEPPSASEAVAFYEFLMAWSKTAPYWFGSWLKNCKCVLMQGGTWSRPSDSPKPFLPRQRADEEFPPGLHIPVANLPDVEGLVDLLDRGAGLKALTWRALVSEYLMPQLSDPEVEQSARDGALAILRNYFDSIRGEGAGDREIRDSVREVLLPARASGEQSSSTLREARELYFGSDWLPNANLETLYGPFGEADFLAIESSGVDDDRAFYAWLGVGSRPAITKLTQLENPSSWRSSSGYIQASRCPKGHPQSQSLATAPMVDRIDEVIATADRERLSILWQHFASGWDYYRPALQAEWRCVAGAAHKDGERSRTFESAVGVLLRSEPWIPAVRDQRSLLARPSDIWRVGPGLPAAVRAMVTSLPSHAARPTPSMAEALGLVDGTSANVGAIVQLLERLKNENAELPALPDHVASAGRWLFAQLEEAESLETLAPGSVPIPARVKGQPRFVRHPYIIRDHLLKTTWGDTVAVYDGDSHLPRVFEALEIPILDESVEIAPLSVDRVESIELVVSSRLDEVRPALLATTAIDYPSRFEALAQQLQALELVCTSELRLKYSLQGHSPRHALTSAFVHEGIAYLEVDEDQPDWSAFGLRLAEYLEVPRLGDAYALLLDASHRARENFLQARDVSQDDLREAEDALTHADELDESDQDDNWDYGEDREAEVDDTSPDSAEEDLTPGIDEGLIGGENSPADDSANDTDTHEDSGVGSDPPARRDNLPSRGGGGAGSGIATGSTGDPGASGSNLGETSDTDQAACAPPDERARDQPLVRFYSFVAARGSREARMAERQEARAMRLGEQGVDRIVAYEADHGRIAEPQPHNNEGFDVISMSPDGSDRRVIEVKATERDWPDRGVPVSDSQVNKNRELGDGFWLYVVEFAADAERARVTAIQNPIAFVDHFAFDPGWSALGEPL